MYPELISQRTFHANSKIKLSFNNKFYLNSNLPNLENINGLYLPKGYGQINELSFKYSSNYFLIHFEPQLIQRKVFEIYTPSKKGPFSKLNDVPLKKDYQSILKNSGLKIFYKGISAGYGNWSKWWGPEFIIVSYFQIMPGVFIIILCQQMDFYHFSIILNTK